MLSFSVYRGGGGVSRLGGRELRGYDLFFVRVMARIFNILGDDVLSSVVVLGVDLGRY